MARLVVRRLLSAIPLLLGVLTLTFFIVESAPGSPADIWIGDRPVPPEVRARIEHAYGLDRPPAERYLRWLGALLLDREWGWSASRSLPVTTVLKTAIPATALLSGAALALHLFVGLAIALLCALRPGRILDRSLSAGGLALYSIPTFWLGLMAILAFAYGLPLFPPSSMHSVGADGWSLPRRLADLAWHLALPAAVVGVASAASLARFLRAGILQAMGEGFIRAARARGATPARVLLAHALRNALLPAIALVGMSLPLLVSGSLVTEVVFAWPGMGRLTYDALLAKDLPVVLATTLVASLLVIVGNLLADLALSLADPRVRLRGGERS